MSFVFTDRPLNSIPLTFGMPAQGTISMDMYREIMQLWIESRNENEQLQKRIAELEATHTKIKSLLEVS